MSRSSINLLHVRHKRQTILAYHFDGTESEAKEFSERWNCSYEKDSMNPKLFCIKCPDNLRIYPNYYVVMYDNRFLRYTPEEFNHFYTVIRSSADRESLNTFLSEE